MKNSEKSANNKQQTGSKNSTGSQNKGSASSSKGSGFSKNRKSGKSGKGTSPIIKNGRGTEVNVKGEKANANKPNDPQKGKQFQNTRKEDYTKDISKLKNVINLQLRGKLYLSAYEVNVLLKRLLVEKKVPWAVLTNLDWKKDVYTLFVALNTWCAIYEDTTEKDGSYLADYLRLSGISEVLASCEKERLALLKLPYDLTLIDAQDIMSETPFWSSCGFPVKQSLRALRACFLFKTDKARDNNIKKVLSEHDIAKELVDANTVLGFPRRISLNALTDVLKNEQFEEFLKGNKKMSHINEGREDGFLSNYIYGGSISGLYATEDDLFPIDSTQERTPEEWDEKHPTLPRFLADRIADYIYAIFKDWKQDTALFTLPPGSSFEGCKTYLKKFEFCIENQQWLRDHGVLMPVLPSKGLNDPADCCRLVAVPKTYKKPRLVAPEPVSRQVLGYQVASGMEKCLKRVGCDLHDQTNNADAVVTAVVDGVSTIDWTAASDSISLKVAEDAWRYLPTMWEVMMACRSGYVIVNGVKYKSHRFATMGNSITFPTESSIFLAAAGVATELAMRDLYPEDYISLQNKCINTVKHRFFADLEDGTISMEEIEHLALDILLPICIMIEYVKVYGDDTEIQNYAYNYLLSFAPLMGFTLNAEKSYTVGQAYRESCGNEAMTFGDGKHNVIFEIPGIYWPRGLSNVALAELVSMQHKMAAAHYTNADRFLRNCILDVFPKITYSEIGSQYDDIWTSMTDLRTYGHSDYGKLLRKVLIYTDAGWTFGKGLKSDKTRCEDGRTISRTTSVLLPEFTQKVVCPPELPEGYALKGKKQRKTKAYIVYMPDNLVPTFTAFFGYSCYVYERKEFISLKELGLEYPGDENIEMHTTIGSKSLDVKLTEDQAWKANYLAYLMTLGRGIEHVNSSEYTAEENKIVDHIDLVVPRQVIIRNQRYPR